MASGIYEHISAVKAPLPYLNAEEPVSWAFYETPKSIMQQNYTPSAFSQNVIQWNENNPSTPSQCALVRKLIKELVVNVTATGTAPVGSNLFQTGTNGYINLRQFPIASVTQNEQLTINNQTTNIQLYDCIHELAKYNTSYEKLAREYACVCMPDHFTDYHQEFNTTSGVFNQLNDAINDSSSAYPFTINSNTNTSFNVTYKIFEPCFCQPLLPDNTAFDAKGIFNINTWSLSETFLGDLTRIFRIALPAGYTLTSFNVVIQSALLHSRWIIPNTTMVNETMYYSGSAIDIFPTQLNLSLAPGASAQINSFANKFTYTPETIILSARESDNVLTYSSTDTWLRINNIAVSYQGNNGLLSSLQPVDIFEMCKEAGLSNTNFVQSNLDAGMGLNQTVSMATNTVYNPGGIPVAMQSPLHLPLIDGNAVGSQAQTQFQVTATVTNTSTTTKVINLYIITITPTVYAIDANGITNFTTTLLDKRRIDSAPVLQSIEGHVESREINGGKISIGRTAKKLLRSIKPKHVRAAIRFAEELGLNPHHVKKAHQAADVLGYGGRMLTAQDKKYIKNKKYLR